MGPIFQGICPKTVRRTLEILAPTVTSSQKNTFGAIMSRRENPHLQTNILNDSDYRLGNPLKKNPNPEQKKN